MMNIFPVSSLGRPRLPRRMVAPINGTGALQVEESPLIQQLQPYTLPHLSIRGGRGGGNFNTQPFCVLAQSLRLHLWVQIPREDECGLDSVLEGVYPRTHAVDQCPGHSGPYLRRLVRGDVWERVLESGDSRRRRQRHQIDRGQRKKKRKKKGREEK